MSADQVCAALGAGLAEAGADPDPCPVADGGEGTAEIVAAALGGERRTASVRDPLGRPVEAEFWLCGAAAYLDLAAASGLGLLGPDELDPWRADTAGTGELMLAAIEAGASRLVVAAGGSATVDGGAGALAALADGGGLQGRGLTILCDVLTPFERAAAVFGPQKGASTPLVEKLASRLDDLAIRLPADPRGRALTGAAGGFAGGLWGALGALLEPGAGFVLDLLDFDRRLAAAEAVIFGEGKLDEQSFAGKIGGEILRRAALADVPVHAVVGTSELTDGEARLRGIATVTVAGDPKMLRQAGATIYARCVVDGRRAVGNPRIVFEPFDPGAREIK
jgi:glycerate kinase